MVCIVQLFQLTKRKRWYSFVYEIQIYWNKFFLCFYSVFCWQGWFSTISCNVIKISSHVGQSHISHVGQCCKKIFQRCVKRTWRIFFITSIRGALKLNLSKNFVFCPNWGGWGSANPKFWFNFSKGVFVPIWRGFPSPNQQNHQKYDFSMKK